MSFISPQFTNAGKKLQARALSGDAQITFTQMGLGDGELATQSISALTDLINPIKKIDISDLRVINPDQVQLKAVFQNIGMVGFFWREVGLFAADPDNPDDRTKDILYCYQNAQDLAEYIPSGDSQLVDKILNMSVVVADATQVKISFFSESYALKEDLEEQTASLKKDLDDHKNDENAHSDIFSQYVKKSGDTMSGALVMADSAQIFKNKDDHFLGLYGGSNFNSGAFFEVYGKDHAEQSGNFNIYANNGTQSARLNGTPNGSLTWQGHEVITAKGGTMNGRLTFLLNDAIYRNVDTSYLHLCGGNVFGKSASLILNGGQNLEGSSSYGGFELSATNGEDITNLIGQSTGTLTWGGKNLVRSVNGVNADNAGNVTISASEIESFSYGIVGYIRYKNGLQICWGSNSDSRSRYTSNATLTFAKPFYDTNYAIIGAGFFINNHAEQLLATTTTSFTTSSYTSWCATGGYIAIGRWK